MSRGYRHFNPECIQGGRLVRGVKAFQQWEETSQMMFVYLLARKSNDAPHLEPMPSWITSPTRMITKCYKQMWWTGDSKTQALVFSKWVCRWPSLARGSRHMGLWCSGFSFASVSASSSLFFYLLSTLVSYPTFNWNPLIIVDVSMPFDESSGGHC